MLDPTNIEALSEAIKKVISNEEIRNNMVRSGLNRSKIFSYEKTVKRNR